uniref:Uncharacterized protein n=1 Tax=Anopheles farauti TaxID=69004 RepID=A0A182QTL8_9DIPT
MELTFNGGGGGGGGGCVLLSSRLRGNWKGDVDNDKKKKKRSAMGLERFPQVRDGYPGFVLFYRVAGVGFTAMGTNPLPVHWMWLNGLKRAFNWCRRDKKRAI